MTKQTRAARPIFLLLVWLCLLGLVGTPAVAAQEVDPASQGAGLVLKLGRPAEGETLYSGPSSLQYNIPINGWAYSDSYENTRLEVRLDVIQGARVISTQVVSPEADGSFLFNAMINPENSEKIFPAEHLGCADYCHFSVELALPPGAVVLHVTVTDPGGQQAFSERRITIDRSILVEVPVRLVMEGDPDVPLEGVSVSASTRLYLWRTRHSLAAVEAGGTGMVQVESLSQAPTHYIFSVEPQVRNGVLFRGADPVEVTLLPGMVEFPEVTLQVQAETGAIQGQVSAPPGASLLEVPVWAFHLPDGESLQAWTAPGGEFSFDPLPIGSYLLTADPAALEEAGLESSGSRVDLSASPQAVVDLPLAARQGLTLQGAVRSADNQPLPFAWVEASQQDQLGAVLPENGQFHLAGLPSDTVTLVASAPGYYSYAQVIDPQAAASLDFTLVPRPETRTIPWGEGEIVIPPESSVIADNGEFQVDYGWLWGEGGGEPVVLQAAGTTLRVQDGRFALEVLPGGQSWFYLFSGQAELLPKGQPASIPIQANQMVALQDGAGTPVAYQPALVRALQASQPAPSPEHSWQPGLQAVLRDRLAQLGIGMAQTVTIATYSLAILALIIGPLLILGISLKKRKKL